MVERVLCIYEVPWINALDSPVSFFFYKVVLVGSRSCSQVIVTGSGD